MSTPPSRLAQVTVETSRHRFREPILIRTLSILLALLSATTAGYAGSWTQVTQTAPGTVGLMVLMSDGTVMAQNNGGSAWYRLTPDSTGSYVNGTWSTPATMHDTRLYCGTQILKDGRLFMAGGEYGTGKTTGEVYDPASNTWTQTPDPAHTFSDANSAMLPDGRVMIALVEGNLKNTLLYDPAANTWSPGPSCNGIHNESAWVKLPDDSILMVDRNATTSERYIPATNTWIPDATVPVSLYDPYGLETGPGMLLPNGKVIFFGALGHTAIYTPSGSTANGTWVAGPDFPNSQGMPDAPCAMMPNGKILCATSPLPTSANHFPTPTSFYEYDYVTNSFASVATPTGGTLSHSSYYGTMLTLPDGTVLYSHFTNQIYSYQGGGSPLSAAKPAISAITKNADGSYHLTGTQLNGINEGSCYGDDNQNASNYPIVRLSDGAGTIYYARTYNWSSNGVATGGTTVSTEFKTPTGLPDGAYSLQVVANGVASDPVSFAVFAFSPSFGVPGTTVTLTGSGFAGATSVTINGVAVSSFTVNSDTQITATVPPSATTGKISVISPAGTQTSSSSFVVLSGDGSPTIATFGPGSGMVGSSVTLTGTNYAGVSSVRFNGVNAAFTVNSTTQITATVPVPVGGVTGPITVTTSMGMATSPSNFTTLATVAAYDSASDVPATANGFTATGTTVHFQLNFMPSAGTNLTVINNTGLGFINGTFSNLMQGQLVSLSYGGSTYNFVANYYGGTGNDLVLVWANNRAVGWGLDNYGQLGNNFQANVLVPASVYASGALAGKTVTQVAAGGSHCVALCSDGTVAAWGYGGSGQLGNNNSTSSGVPVAVATVGTALSGKTVTAVAAGGSHSIALCSDGSVAAWGYGYDGELGNGTTAPSLVPVSVNLSGRTATAIAAGGGHAMALCTDGTILAWGANASGQLGNNSTTNAPLPVAVTTSGSALDGKTITAVAAGGSHSLALCSDGTLMAWGSNNSGQLGNNSTIQSVVAVAVSTTGTALAGKTVTKIAQARGSHNLVLCSDGTLAAWGLNTNGQLGIGTTTNSLVAVNVTTAGTVLAGKTVIEMAAGGAHSLVRCTDGTLAAWGAAGNGQLGNNTTVNSTLPVSVAQAGPPLAGKTVTSISAGTNYSVVASSDGAAFAWGYDYDGEVGDNALTASAPVAVTAASTALAGKTITAVSTGESHSLALCSDGTVFGWGHNLYGSLGNNTTTSSSVPVAVSTTGVLAGKTVVAVSAGDFHSLALCSDGTLASWGYNNTGQLGNNSTTNSNVPVLVTTAGTALAGKTVVAISAGGGGIGSHSLALCSDGTVVAWGYNYYGQLGNNSTTQSLTAVAVSAVGTALSGKTVVSIAAGQAHSLALCQDGTVAAWGFNYYGLLGNGSTTNSSIPVAVNTSGILSGKTVVAIGAGDWHSLAVCSDGTLAAWGNNNYGQLGNNSIIQSTLPVAVSRSGVLSGKTITGLSASYRHSLAWCSDGTMAAWGYNKNNELGNNSTTNSLVPTMVDTSSFLVGERFARGATGPASSHNLGIVASPPSPRIAVQYPVGENLTNNGSVVDFGNSVVGTAVTRTFTILNNGLAPMTISDLTFSGANSSDFTVSRAPTNPIPTGGSTTMDVTFSPGAALNRSATLNISSNDQATSTFSVNFVGTGNGVLAATYSSAATVPLTVPAFTANGCTVNFSLSYAPVAGTTLTVVKNTGMEFIEGQFDNLGHGQTISLPYNGVIYRFVANYYGGSGNDLVLQWAESRPVGWGLDNYSQIGNNNPTNFLVPIGVTANGVLAGKTVTAVAGGSSHSVALCSDGTVFTWGLNSNGQLGNGNTTQSTSPVAVTGTGALAGKTVTAIAAGSLHTLALCSDGTVAAWGQNINGQLGNSSTAQSTVPVLVSTSGALSGKTVTAIAAGSSHSMALCSDGTLVTWGYNSFGQLGNNSTLQSTVPVAITGAGSLSGKTVAFIAAGSSHSLAACTDGTVSAWGFNLTGQLGNNSTTQSGVPVAVYGSGALSGKTVVGLAGGYGHSLARCSDGTLVTWGSNSNGQLGNNSTTQSLVPVTVVSSGALSGRTVTKISAGLYHNVARCSDGTLVTWGYNSNGQLGNNSTTQSTVPVVVITSGTPLSGKTAASVAAGSYHSIALASDGTLGTWGKDLNGQLGNSIQLFTTAPIATTVASTALNGQTILAQSAGQSHSLALCADGTVTAWGYNTYGQLGNGTTVDSPVAVAVDTTGVLVDRTVVAVASGYWHSLALCSDGGLAAWGYNNYGQLGNNSILQSNLPVAVNTSGVLAGKTVVSIAAGSYHCLALCSDGTLAAWGFNNYGQLGNNSTTQSSVPVAVTTAGTPLSGKTVVAIAAGSNHSLALCTDGTVATWGFNTYGQLGNNSTTNSSVPVAVNSAGALLGKTVVSISAGSFHSLALCSDGTVAAWGYNTYGQLGNNSISSSNVPLAINAYGVLSGRTVTELSAGQYHSLALCSDGTAAAWGYNTDGELGIGSTTNSLVPTAVNTASLGSGQRLMRMVSGEAASHSLALVAVPPHPQLLVQQPAGNNLTSGVSTVDFGASPVGASITQTFTLINGGDAPLSITGTMIDGVNSGDYAVTTPPSSLVATGSSTTMVVTFTPSAQGARNATLHISSNDPDTSPFDTPLTGAGAIALTANYSSGSDIPLSASSVNATGGTVSFTLNYTPVPGTTLTVVRNTGPGFIAGRFNGLAQGQAVTLTRGGVNYQFVANYYGGNGNDLVLQWADTVPYSWGQNLYGQLDNGTQTAFNTSVGVDATGALAGRTLTSVATGLYHNVGLCSDGTVVSWGYNNYGQLGNNATTNSNVPVLVDQTGVLAGKTVVAVAAGSYHCVALCSDGTVATWGFNTYGQLGNNSTTNSSTPVAASTSGVLSGKTVSRITAGYYHTLALCTDGTIATWGYNNYGQLGNNSTTNSSTPVAVNTSGALSGKTVSRIAAGYYHTLALCTDGTIATWGYNSYGQLGNNTTTNSSVPVTAVTSGVLSGRTIAALSCGAYHSLALCTDGTVSTWGYNINGQLGNSSSTNSSVPVAVLTTGVLSGKTVATISGGYYHSIAVCTDGTIASWGYNFYGQLGNGTYATTTVPVLVTKSGTFLSGKTPVAASAGFYHSIILCSDGTAAGVGYDHYGQLGNGTIGLVTVPSPVVRAGTVMEGKTLLSISTGNGHSLALCSDGSVAAWGSNTYGQLGNNSTTLSPSPVPITSTGVLAGKTVVSISAGSYHSLALCSDGTVAAWGYNFYGQLGNNSTINSSTPVLVSTSGALAGKTVTAIAAGGLHSLALCSDGTLVSWGYNNNGQLGNNSYTNSSVPVVVASGGTPLSGKTPVSLAAGYYHCAALCTDGTMVAWGNNAYGQLGNNSTTNNPVPVAVVTSGTPLAGKTPVSLASGYYHLMALCSDGTVACWGYNTYGQLGNNSTTSSSLPVAAFTGGVLAGKTVTSVTAGFYHCLALCSDGSLLSWGYNTDGQLGNAGTTNNSVPVLVNSTSIPYRGAFGACFSCCSAYHSFALVGNPPSAPSIALEQPTGSSLTSGSSTVDFGGCPVGSSVTRTFSILNSGNAPLSISSTSLDGVNGTEFSVTTPPATLIAAGDRTTMVVTFTPNGNWLRSAVMHITSTDPYNPSFDVSLVGGGIGTLDASFASAADVPLTLPGMFATGSSVNLSLRYAPAAGTTLTVVRSTGPASIIGTFSNLTQGQAVTLSYGGKTYNFIANYYGGTGNDLVLQWAAARPVDWGLNTYGQLGNNSTTSSSTPVSVITGGNPLQDRALLVAASGYQHTALLCSDGTIAEWGYNNYGQLGNGTITNSSVPLPITTAGTPLATRMPVVLSGGYGHTVALCSDGTVVTWGYNNNGQLGNGTTINSSIPVAVTTSGTALQNKTVSSVSAGTYHNVALCSDGSVVSWGYNSYGNLGNGNSIQSNVPVALTTSGTPAAGKTIVSVVAGGYHDVALCSDGTILTWGYNAYGQLGNGTLTNSSLPVAVTVTGTALTNKTVVAVGAGHYHSLALCSDGTVVTWGYNNNGQLGNGTLTNSSLAVAVTTTGTALANKTVTSVNAGYYSSTAMCSDGTIAMWGYNTDGELGNNSTSNSSTAVAVSTSSLTQGETFMAVACGQSAYQSLALVAEPPAPSAVTLAATSITATSAVLNGTVNAASGSAAVTFDYGTTSSYGASGGASPSTVTGVIDTQVSKTLSALTPSTTYHFRVTAVSAGGTSNGEDFTFATPSNIATLDSLGLSEGTLAPAFSSVQTTYAATVANSTTSIAVTPATTHSAATVAVRVNGSTFAGVTSGSASNALALNTGANTVDVRITAQDGTSITTYTVTITRNTPYGDWAANNNMSGPNAGPSQSYLGDGIPNLEKYAFGISPIVPGSLGYLHTSGGSLTTRGGPILLSMPDGSGGTNRFAEFLRRKDAATAGLIYVVEFSSNLLVWEASSDTPTVVASDATMEAVTVPFPALVNGQPPKFFRVKVTGP